MGPDEMILQLRTLSALEYFCLMHWKHDYRYVYFVVRGSLPLLLGLPMQANSPHQALPTLCSLPVPPARRSPTALPSEEAHTAPSAPSADSVPATG